MCKHKSKFFDTMLIYTTYKTFNKKKGKKIIIKYRLLIIKIKNNFSLKKLKHK